jgi:hypothetical protein
MQTGSTTAYLILLLRRKFSLFFIPSTQFPLEFANGNILSGSSGSWIYSNQACVNRRLSQSRIPTLAQCKLDAVSQCRLKTSIAAGP